MSSTMASRSTMSSRSTMASRSRAVTVSAVSRPAWHTVVGAAAATVSMTLLSANMAHAAYKLPPIDNDPNRCDRGYDGNTIGQANAVADRTLDLRNCSYVGANLRAKVLAGALMSNADYSNADMQEAVLTKAYAHDVNLSGADLTNGVIDRVDFTGSNMKGTKFVNAIITGTTFIDVDLTDAVFEDAVIGGEDAKRLCANPTLKGESRYQVGCRT